CASPRRTELIYPDEPVAMNGMMEDHRLRAGRFTTVTGWRLPMLSSLRLRSLDRDRLRNRGGAAAGRVALIATVAALAALAAATGVFASPPTVPRSVSASAGANQATVSWIAPS